jgi:AraC-like DNA-binding protein
MPNAQAAFCCLYAVLHRTEEALKCLRRVVRSSWRKEWIKNDPDLSRYLQDRRLSIVEVAYLLGYSEPPAFHRAFKRWNAITPQEYRHRQAEEGPS